MKLVAAKCPSCGANLNVDSERKDMFCEYCGTKIIVEEAIQKYQLEISGKVEVDGIQTNDAKVAYGKTLERVGNYKEAIETYFDAVNNSVDNVAAAKALVNICNMMIDGIMQKRLEREKKMDNFAFMAQFSPPKENKKKDPSVIVYEEEEKELSYYRYKRSIGIATLEQKQIIDGYLKKSPVETTLEKYEQERMETAKKEASKYGTIFFIVIVVVVVVLLVIGLTT